MFIDNELINKNPKPTSMIGKLKGRVSDIYAGSVIVDVGGVGYEVLVGPAVLPTVIKDAQQTFYIYTHVREDQLSLFGFLTRRELDFFKLLLSVSNVGPKTALLVMGVGTVDEIVSAIEKSDADFFTSVPRVGKKNAARIIVELRSKVGALGEVDLTFGGNSEDMDVVEALVNFGFNKSEALGVVKKLPKGVSLDEKVKLALKGMGR